MRPTLRIGARGPDVAVLQQALVTAGALGPGEADGIFGLRTGVAVRHYQRALGLTVDGVVGDETWGALKNILSTLEPAMVTPDAPGPIRHGFYVWSEKNYTWFGPGLLDRIKGWFGLKGKLAVNDLVDTIQRTRPAIVTVKTRDGRARLNTEPFIRTVLDAAEGVGAERSVWAYVYPWNPGKRPDLEACRRYLGEQAANIASDCRTFRAASVVLNAEKQWFHVEGDLVTYFVEQLRASLARYGLSGVRVAWSSYALPSSFPNYPWGAWCVATDEAWPQLYSGGKPGYEKRARKSALEHQGLGARAVVFGGPLYRGEKEMARFLSGVSGVVGTLPATWKDPHPCEVSSVAVWWSTDQLTEAREAVMLPPA